MEENNFVHKNFDFASNNKLEMPKESIQKPLLPANMVEIKEKNKPRTSLNGTASSEQFKTEEESNEKLDYPQIVLEKVTSTKWDWTKDVASNIKELKDRVAHLEAKTDEFLCKKAAGEIHAIFSYKKR